jgi:DNA-binding response OmpR family regulator
MYAKELKMKILILEDERTLALSMQEFLEDSSYEVDCYRNSDKAFDVIYANSYDLLLLDVNVRGQQNGFELLRSLRKMNIATPAIFVTSLNNMENLIKGYASGCCDYLKKPFDLTELKLRVEQVIKMYCFVSQEHLIYLSDDYVYDTKKRQLSLHNEVIRLGKIESKIFELLIQHRGSIVTNDIFSINVWNDDIDSTNIRMQISSLRSKLKPNFIRNSRGLGYGIEI